MDANFSKTNAARRANKLQKICCLRVHHDPTSTLPICTITHPINNPVDCPVSSSSSVNNLAVYLASSVCAPESRNWPTIPAACQVVPEAICFLSIRTASLTPRLARWYSVEIPVMPPPMTTTDARSGRELLMLAVLGAAPASSCFQRNFHAIFPNDQLAIPVLRNCILPVLVCKGGIIRRDKMVQHQ